MKPAVTVVGEALIDIIQAGSGDPEEHVGGSPTNVAIGLSRLGHDVELSTYLGGDERGLRIAEFLAAERVTLGPASVTAPRTSSAAVRLDPAGVASYDFDLTWEFDPDAGVIAPGTHLHTGSIAATLRPGADGLARTVAAAGPTSTISYDPNIRPALMESPSAVGPIIEMMIRHSDVVKASAEDIEWLYPGKPLRQVLADWARLGPAICTATAGGGSVVVLAGGEFCELPPLVCTVVDTVGAGDSFMAGLISGLLDGRFLGDANARERLRFAHFDQLAAAFDRALACAAVTVSRTGADPPTRADLHVDF
jgi:fructokinase